LLEKIIVTYYKIVEIMVNIRTNCIDSSSSSCSLGSIEDYISENDLDKSRQNNKKRKRIPAKLKQTCMRDSETASDVTPTEGPHTSKRLQPSAACSSMNKL